MWIYLELKDINFSEFKQSNDAMLIQFLTLNLLIQILFRKIECLRMNAKHWLYNHNNNLNAQLLQTWQTYKKKIKKNLVRTGIEFEIVNKHNGDDNMHFDSDCILNSILNLAEARV